MAAHRPAVGVALAAALATGACSPAPAPSASAVPTALASRESAAPAFATVTCPDEVTVVIVVTPSCGYLTAPEHHARPDGRTLRVFVVRIEPQSGVEAPDAMVVVGETLGARMEYGGLATLAQRTGRVVYLVDQRGTGLSGVSLDCPEVEAASSAMLSLPSDHAAANDALIAAVRTCRERLTRDGVDLSAYRLRESALDVEDLRIALGLEQWNVIAFGSSSRLALEVARLAPGGVRTLVLDSPVLAQGPSPLFNANATATAIASVGAACAADPACQASYPDVPGAIADAIAALRQAPASVEVPALDGAWSGTLHVDGLRFARAARTVMGADGGAQIGELLAAVEDVIAGHALLSDPIVRSIVESDGLCLGYVPDCRRIVVGSMLMAACSGDVPFVDRSDVGPGGVTPSALSGIFEVSPFFTACDAWDVEVDPGSNEPVLPGMPVLAMVGAMDPFTGSVADLQAAKGLESALVLEVPRHSYNVFGFNECPRQVRRQWLDAPNERPDTACFDQIRIVDLSL